MYHLTFVLATRNLLVSESVWASRRPDFSPELYTSTAILASVPCNLAHANHASLSLSLSLWYPRHKLQYRVGLFFGAATLAGAFSGLLAFAIEFMGGTRGLEAWSWIFVRDTVFHAVCMFICLATDPWRYRNSCRGHLGLLQYDVFISSIGLPIWPPCPCSPCRLSVYGVVLDTRGTGVRHPQEEYVLLLVSLWALLDFSCFCRVRQLHRRRGGQICVALCLGSFHRLASLAAHPNLHVYYWTLWVCGLPFKHCDSLIL